MNSRLALGEEVMDCAPCLTGRKTLPFLYRLEAFFQRSSFEPKARFQQAPIKTRPKTPPTDATYCATAAAVTPHPNGSETVVFWTTARKRGKTPWANGPLAIVRSGP